MRTRTNFWAARVMAVCFLVAGLSFTALVARAEVPSLINYQGRLLDTNDMPVSGTVSVVVTLHSTATGGTELYRESVGSVPVVSGSYNFAFGSDTEALKTALQSAEVWIEVAIDGSPLAPRQRLLSVPYALVAGNAGGDAGGWTSEGGVVHLVSETGKVGIGTDEPEGQFHVAFSDTTFAGVPVFERTAEQADALKGTLFLSAASKNQMGAGFGPALAFRVKNPSTNFTTAIIGTVREASDDSAAMVIRTKNGPHTGERVRITGAGRVGLGTDSPGEQLDLAGGRIGGVGAPDSDDDAANKAYVDAVAGGPAARNSVNSDAIVDGSVQTEDLNSNVRKANDARYVLKAGDTMNGPLILERESILPEYLGQEVMVENDKRYVRKAGDTMTGALGLVDGSVHKADLHADVQAANDARYVRKDPFVLDPESIIPLYLSQEVTADNDNRYVRKTGDTMTGKLVSSLLHVKSDSTAWASPHLLIESTGSGSTRMIQVSKGFLIRNDNASGTADAFVFRNGANTDLMNVKADGEVSVGVLTVRGADVAEPFVVAGGEQVAKGSVVIIDDQRPGELKLSERPYDRRVAGVVSGAGGLQPGVSLVQAGTDGAMNVALSGRVYTQASACNGPIRPGDLLTTATVPGRAMKATDPERSHGSVIGKAMSSLEEGEGLVLVLVNLQ